MRGLRNFIILICELIIFALLVIFAVENITPMRYRFIGNTFMGNVWWTVAGSALLGFLFALFLLGPGTVAASMSSRSWRRQHGRTGEELAALRAEHERLRAEHARTLSERNQLQSALSAMSATNAANTETTATTTSYDASDGETDGITHSSATERNIASQPLASTNPRTNYETDPEAAQAAQGSGWRGRLRQLREGNEGYADDMDMTNSPPAPTA